VLRFSTSEPIFSDDKMDLVGALGRSTFKNPSSFSKCTEKQNKKLRKNGF